MPNAFRSCSSKPLPPHKLTGNTHTYIDRESVADRDDAHMGASHIRNCMRASHISDITLACKRDAAAVAQREPRREEWPLADAVAPPDPSDEEVPDDLQMFKHTDA